MSESSEIKKPRPPVTQPAGISEEAQAEIDREIRNMTLCLVGSWFGGILVLYIVLRCVYSG